MTLDRNLSTFNIMRFCILFKSSVIAGLHLRWAGIWDLGPFTGVLEPGQMSPQATEYKETIRD